MGDKENLDSRWRQADSNALPRGWQLGAILTPPTSRKEKPQADLLILLRVSMRYAHADQASETTNTLKVEFKY